MNTNPIFKALLITGVVASQACNPIYYSPNTQNVPLLSGKGDHSITVSGNDTRGELQAAYAVTDHFSLGLTGGFVSPKDDEEGDGGSGKFGEIQGGYFQNFSDHFVFETTGMLGFGNVENHFPSTLTTYPNTDGKVEANLLRFGIQPAIGYRTRFFEAAVSARLASLNYSNASGGLIFGQDNQVKFLEDNKSLWIVEPALTLRGGLEFLKFQIQLSPSFNLTNRDFPQDDGLVTIGLVYRPKR